MGCEYDVLCHEAHEMAKKLGGNAAAGKNEAEDWEVGGVKWMRVKDQRHGFTHTTMKGEKEAERLKATESLWREMDRWMKGVFEEGRSR